MIKDLDDIAWFQEGPGVRNYQYTTNGTKLINVSNLGGINLNLSNTSRYISNEEANGKYRHFLCDAGDLVIASSGINETSISEKVSIIKRDDLPLCMNTSVIRFKPLNNDELSVKYLYYFFKSDSYKKQIMKLMTGIAQLNYGPSHLHRIKINYVEKAQQERITSQLDSLSSLVETQKKQLTLLDELVKSRFIEMFGDPDANPFDWEIVTINDVCSSIVRGPFGSALKKEFFVPKSETTIKVYEQQHAIKKNDKLGTYYVTKEKYQSLKRFTCHEGDILMSCSGTMGELYQLPIGCEKGIINQALCKFTLNQKMLPIVFLESMKHVVDQIDKKGSGIQNIAAVSYVKSMKMCLPPIQIQKKFVTFYEQVDKSKFIVQERIKLYQELLNKKMDEYFN